MNFPSNPTNGQKVTQGYKSWTWSAATQTWDLDSTVDAVAAAAVAARDETLALKVATEAARDATNTSGKIFTSAEGTAAGLAATTNGQNFDVLAADSLSWTRYRNNSGVALALTTGYTKGHLDNLVRTGSGIADFLRISDDYGYGHFYLNAQGLGTLNYQVGEAGLSTPTFALKQDNTASTLRMVDEFGYAGMYLSGAALGDIESIVKSTGVYANPFSIIESKAGTAFAVTDGNGYFTMHIPSGKAAGATDALENDVAALKAGTGSSLSARTPAPRLPVSAHRGTTVGGIAPENSLDAYLYSARAGYRIVETDVLKTADGQFVIMHDGSINRTMRMKADYSALSGTVNVAATTLADLRANYVLASANPRQRRPIPTFQEFLAVCRDCGLHPIIELKDGSYTNADISAIFVMARRYLGDGNFTFTSFSQGQLDYARTLSPKLRLAYILTASSSALAHVATKLPATLNAAYAQWTDALVEEAKSLGVGVTAWTVPNTAFDTVLRLGLEEIATDTVAPPLSDQKVLLRDYSELDFASYTTNGSKSDGVLTLAQNQSMTFSKSALTNVGELGAAYVGFDFKGVANITATRATFTATNAGEDYQACNFQNLLYREGFAFTIVAGAGGCAIKDVRLAVAQF